MSGRRIDKFPEPCQEDKEWVRAPLERGRVKPNEPHEVLAMDIRKRLHRDGINLKGDYLHTVVAKLKHQLLAVVLKAHEHDQTRLFNEARAFLESVQGKEWLKSLMAPESHQVHTRQPLEVTVIDAVPDSIDALAPMVSYPRQADRSHSPASPRLLARNNMAGRPIDRTNLEIPRYQHDQYQHRHLGGGNVNILDGRCPQCGRTALEHWLELLAALAISQQGPLVGAPSVAPTIVIPSGVHASTQAREVQTPTTDTNWRIGLWIMLFACLFVMTAVIIANF